MLIDKLWNMGEGEKNERLWEEERSRQDWSWMQVGSPTHADLTVCINSHRSFLSLTVPCSSTHLALCCIINTNGLQISLLGSCLAWVEVSHMATEGHRLAKEMMKKQQERHKITPNKCKKTLVPMYKGCGVFHMNMPGELSSSLRVFPATQMSFISFF